MHVGSNAVRKKSPPHAVCAGYTLRLQPGTIRAHHVVIEIHIRVTELPAAYKPAAGVFEGAAAMPKRKIALNRFERRNYNTACISQPISSQT